MVVELGQKVLLVCTSNSKLGDSEEPTGAGKRELAEPYYLFKRRGFEVTVGSIRGGPIPFENTELINGKVEPLSVLRVFEEDPSVQTDIANSLSIVHVDGSEFDAIFVVGGHGIMWDGPYNAELLRVIETAYSKGKILAAVGHGAAAFVRAKNDDGELIVRGKQVTGFSNREEETVNKTGLIPFALETTLKELGALYTRGKANWTPHAVRAGNLITGQNPASAQRTAEMVVEALTMGVRLT